MLGEIIRFKKLPSRNIIVYIIYDADSDACVDEEQTDRNRHAAV